METLITGDGSATLYNSVYGEHYHSRIGAVEEAVEKYVKPCKVEELSKKGHIRILDICFGLGYNSVAAIDHAKLINPNCEIEVIGLEKDESLIEEYKKLSPNLKSYGLLRSLEYDPANKAYFHEEKNVFIRIKIGDARETIKKLLDKFDAVFLDPFSPPKNPELWTKEFFLDIKKCMKQDAILATYSCARLVRDNLKAAGFIVTDGPKVGRRAPSTLAKMM